MTFFIFTFSLYNRDITKYCLTSVFFENKVLFHEAFATDALNTETCE